LKIVIETIEHEEQRYPTVGDWFYWNKTLHIKVSETDNNDYNYLIALHELVEAWLCQKRGIIQEEVDAFDIAYEFNRQPGDDSEPGDNISAPYRDEHCIATGVERIVCAALGLPWKDYEETLERL
jgi:hypothetical protein